MRIKSIHAAQLMIALTTAMSVSAGVCSVPGAAANQKSSAKHKAPPGGAKPTAEIAAGKKVYDSQGCSACHAIAGSGGSSGPDLTTTGAVPAHSPKWLADQVSNPKSHTPTSTMPSFAKTIRGKDLAALSLYLASLKSAPAAAGTSRSPVGGSLNPAAVDRIEKAGGEARQIAQTDNHVEVSFSMAGASVTDATLALLTGINNIEQLDLGKTSVTDAGLARIKGLTGLTELHLENTKITDAGLINLKGMHQLYYLNLYGDNITDAGLEHLSGLTSLRRLFLWRTKVTDEGINKLKKSLPQLEVIRGWDEAPKK